MGRPSPPPRVGRALARTLRRGRTETPGLRPNRGRATRGRGRSPRPSPGTTRGRSMSSIRITICSALLARLKPGHQRGARVPGMHLARRRRGEARPIRRSHELSFIRLAPRRPCSASSVRAGTNRCVWVLSNRAPLSGHCRPDRRRDPEGRGPVPRVRAGLVVGGHPVHGHRLRDDGARLRRPTASSRSGS